MRDDKARENLYKKLRKKHKIETTFVGKNQKNIHLAEPEIREFLLDTIGNGRKASAFSSQTNTQNNTNPVQTPWKDETGEASSIVNDFTLNTDDDDEDEMLSTVSNASDESLGFINEEGKSEVPSPYDDPLVLLIDNEEKLSEASLQKIRSVFKDEVERADFKKAWKYCKKHFRYPVMLVKVLLIMVLDPFDKSKIPKKFIQDPKYKFERLIVKILCAKYHTKIPNIQKQDMSDPDVCKYVEGLKILKLFLEKHQNQVTPMLFRGMKCMTMKEKNISAEEEI